MKKLEITLYKSLIGRTPNQVKNAHHLGLRKINQKVIKEDIPTVRGVLNKIHHLVVVKEVLEGRV
ncbi:50S ribosomal protein L30 [Candidatus Phytoplasma pruni]|uniref:50S ribosomal protein L30 n=1 Tax=Candidatus Phytoplasma pruni TaxID=479893 RepID=A0A0M1MZY8_9MOLU|nr:MULTISPECIES: 50S ribosomal protein L30 [16SrIII (X-disease group)]KOR75471.1 50S ribosomal protein L30 [Candidatus Phytoplasma pruni]MCQ9618674.1 50S ribosomal protein L30 [Candidatus Phytoplasma pruni]MDW3617797.1 50S ribosomal protein L30 [Candidatus Phytoplasma pruni]WEK82390.1 MAG: 50S ribosomal protein L30 [Candidatus Phytoplasma pruni]